MLEQTLHALITSDAGFIALAGDRLHPVVLPETPTFPAVTYQRITSPRRYTTTGPVDINNVRMQFDCWTVWPKYTQVKELQAALLAILDGYHDDDTIDSIQVDNIEDGFESDARLFRVTIDLLINVIE